MSMPHETKAGASAIYPLNIRASRQKFFGFASFYGFWPRPFLIWVGWVFAHQDYHRRSRALRGSVVCLHMFSSRGYCGNRYAWSKIRFRNGGPARLLYSYVQRLNVSNKFFYAVMVE
jgi:hypothetical protein